MSAALVAPLLGVYAGVAVGFGVGRLGWLDRLGAALGSRLRITSLSDPVHLLGQIAFLVFVPALLFRTTARLDTAHLPWRTLAAYFAPAVLLLLMVYAGLRWRRQASATLRPPTSQALAPQAPAVTAITATFGNTVQLGIPVAATLFGEPGLALHLGIIALHALILMTLATVLAEVDTARAAARGEASDRMRGVAGLAWQTARRSLVHPVTLPVLAGLAWNLAGWPLPLLVDETLGTLARAAVPLCLLLIGLALARADGLSALRRSLRLVGFKLLAMPAVVGLVAGGVFGLSGLPLNVLVMAAALPAGSNALLFAQRYGVLQADTAVAVAGSTVLFALSAPLWLLVLQGLA